MTSTGSNSCLIAAYWILCECWKGRVKGALFRHRRFFGWPGTASAALLEHCLSITVYTQTTRPLGR